MSDKFNIIIKGGYTEVEKMAIEQAWEGLLEFMAPEHVQKAKLYINSLTQIEYRAGVRDGKTQIRKQIIEIFEDSE